MNEERTDERLRAKTISSQGENRMGKKDQRNRCKGKNKQGKPCQAAATAGGLCFFHANPNKASELGRMGGRKNRHFALPEGDALPLLDNTMAIRDRCCARDSGEPPTASHRRNRTRTAHRGTRAGQ